MKSGYFNGIEISLCSRLDGFPIILIKNDGEDYKAPVGEDGSGNGKIFCQTIQQIRDVRDSLNFTILELNRILEN